ncbi:FkbM family methyltransferase [Citrobacter portucalensis]|uniref:FkbM family methyltransferase n=1 Tax=Citrobacter portucalensis TaxID=1639133 RepID=UPI0039FD1D74|nr:FkbM family methyltransferase [Citrobacter freundii]
MSLENHLFTLKSLDEKINHINTLFLDTDFEIAKFNHNEKEINIFHVKNDYIPSRIIYEKNFYESAFLQFFSFFNYNNGCVLDIGGNIGNHSIYFSAIKNWNVIAFEPVMQNALCLAINAQLNNSCDKIHLIDTALGKEEGHCFLSAAINGNEGSFSRDAEINTKSVEVPIQILDNIPDVKNITDTIGLIKIDVEGMEYEVLQGAMHTLQTHKPALAFECTTQQHYIDIVNLISPLGYFPIEILNYTATFIFLNKNNHAHTEKLIEYLTMYVNQRKQTQYHIF